MNESQVLIYPGALPNNQYRARLLATNVAGLESTSKNILFAVDTMIPVSGMIYVCDEVGVARSAQTDTGMLRICIAGYESPLSGIPLFHTVVREANTDQLLHESDVLMDPDSASGGLVLASSFLLSGLSLPCNTVLTVQGTAISGAGVAATAQTSPSLTIDCTPPSAGSVTLDMRCTTPGEVCISW